MLNRLQEIEQKVKEAVNSAVGSKDLDKIRVEYLGKKGEITRLLRGVKDLDPAERPAAGQMVNRIKNYVEELLREREEELRLKEQRDALERETIDVTLPGRLMQWGKKHPLTLILEEIEDIFTSIGFEIAEGPEIETDYYNFEALNIPKDHPARDMQDSFYITQEILLRTHTSPVQVRVMEQIVPELPVRIIAPGKVYRRDDDATHSPMFHQVEGLALDKRITFADLKGTLLLFVRQMFGADQQIRLRPSYFPFTEPSAEVDISCIMCGGKGCRVCGSTGWLEILGAGMVHPKVLQMSGYNPEEVTGYAFGMGVERIAMLKFGINDLRLFFTNDMRMLEQF